MDIHQERLDPDIVIIRPKGRLDAKDSPTLRATLQDVINDGLIGIIVDMKDVHFIDSSGLAALVSGLRAAREKGSTITLTRAQSQAKVVFQLTMLDRVIPIFETIDEAKASVAGGGT